ncbi:hypothetical protein V8E55_000591 [Tylopilus felleus]
MESALTQHTSLPPNEHDLHALSEVQLRQLYDEEEVERFMSLFSAYVTEVRLSTSVAGTRSTECHTMHNSDTATGRPSIPPHSANYSLSEDIAYNYFLPYLPPAAGVSPTFTLNRLSLTLQRLYLALFPPYKAFLLDLARLALWKDYQRSLRHCIAFWFLWLHDLLLPALVFRVVFGLLRRCFSTHPTLKELQERRQEAARALRFGEAVQQRLSVTTLGPLELWRLFKLYKSEGKRDTIETEEEEDLKRDLLHALNELADFHERIKNIFTWRRPDVSRRYLFFFIVIGFGVLVLPAQYIAKLVYWFGGVLFWHVTPVVAALPRGHRTRVLFLFRDAPTDADYAMELIAKRIATGQDVGIASHRNQSSRLPSNDSASSENLVPTLDGHSHDARPSEDDGINWKKWGERIARGKSFLEEGRQLLSNPSGNGMTADTSHSGAEDGHTFLAEYASFPGLITLTPSTLYFTSLAGTRARLVIPRDRVRGVKKSGLVRGLSLTWTPEELADGGEREEKFRWVGNRDELFARLVGSTTGGRWMTV